MVCRVQAVLIHTENALNRLRQLPMARPRHKHTYSLAHTLHKELGAISFLSLMAGKCTPCMVPNVCQCLRCKKNSSSSGILHSLVPWSISPYRAHFSPFSRLIIELESTINRATQLNNACLQARSLWRCAKPVVCEYSILSAGREHRTVRMTLLHPFQRVTGG